MADYSIHFPFLTDDPQFTLGYECGTIATLMESDVRLLSYTMHSANIEQVKIICKAKHYEVSFEQGADGWCFMSASRIGAN